MKYSVRKDLNEIISNIKIAERKIEQREGFILGISAEQFEEQWIDAVELLNEHLEIFERTIDNLWYSNKCRQVQYSLNYYLRKAGMNTRTITALF